MGGYDAAVKVILDRCRDTALSYFLGLSVEESEIVEIPQETVTVRRADFPLRVVTSDKKERIVVLEVQTRWSWDVPLRLLEYEVRYRRRYRLASMGAVLLLTPSERCVDHFRDGGIDYRFNMKDTVGGAPAIHPPRHRFQFPSGLRSVLGWCDVSELYQHPNPTWGVTFNVQGFEVYGAVSIGLVSRDHVENGAQDLVGNGDDGSFVTSSGHEALKLGFKG